MLLRSARMARENFYVRRIKFDLFREYYNFTLITSRYIAECIMDICI